MKRENLNELFPIFFNLTDLSQRKTTFAIVFASLVDELKSRIPNSVTCEGMTMEVISTLEKALVPMEVSSGGKLNFCDAFTTIEGIRPQLC